LDEVAHIGIGPDGEKAAIFYGERLRAGRSGIDGDKAGVEDDKFRSGA
jgi:hypothetical protein